MKRTIKVEQTPRGMPITPSVEKVNDYTSVRETRIESIYDETENDYHYWQPDGPAAYLQQNHDSHDTDEDLEGRVHAGPGCNLVKIDNI